MSITIDFRSPIDNKQTRKIRKLAKVAKGVFPGAHVSIPDVPGEGVSIKFHRRNGSDLEVISRDSLFNKVREIVVYDPVHLDKAIKLSNEYSSKCPERALGFIPIYYKVVRDYSARDFFS